MEKLQRKNAEICASVERLAAEHTAMVSYIEMVLPFIGSNPAARDCSAYEDGVNLLKRIGQ